MENHNKLYTVYIPDVLLGELQVGVVLLYLALDVLVPEREIHHLLGLIVKLEVSIYFNLDLGLNYVQVNCE